MTKHHNPFRHFCTEKWHEHKEEILDWTRQTVDYDSTYYFRKHRWLLKAMFKNQIKEEASNANK